MEERYNEPPLGGDGNQGQFRRTSTGNNNNDWDQNRPSYPHYDNSVYPAGNDFRQPRNRPSLPNMNNNESNNPRNGFGGRRPPLQYSNQNQQWRNNGNNNNNNGNQWNSNPRQFGWIGEEEEGTSPYPTNNLKRRRRNIINAPKEVVTKKILSKHIYIVIILLFSILAFQGYIVYNFHTTPQYCYSGISSFMLPSPPPKKSYDPNLSSSSAQENELRKQSLPSSDTTCPSHLPVGGECTKDNECCTNFCHPKRKQCSIRKGLGEKCDFLDCYDKLICRGKPSQSMLSKDRRDKTTKKYPLKKTRKCQTFGNLEDGYECQIHRECKNKHCNHKLGICESSVQQKKTSKTTTTTTTSHNNNNQKEKKKNDSTSSSSTLKKAKLVKEEVIVDNRKKSSSSSIINSKSTLEEKNDNNNDKKEDTISDQNEEVHAVKPKNPEKASTTSKKQKSVRKKKSNDIIDDDEDSENLIF